MSADIGWEEYQQICDKLSRANARVSELEDADRSLRSRLAEATATIERLTRERDEAKSLVARLNDVHSDVTSKARLAVIRAEALSTELAKAQQERDEARASLERMQEAMKDLADECDKISDALNEQTARAIVLGARALEKARRP